MLHEHTKKVPGDGFPGTGATWAASSVTEGSIPQPPANPIASEIERMRSFAAELDERTLATWALRLRDADVHDNRRGYLWRELARLEIRRRHRNVDVISLDNCPLCGAVGRWWRNQRTGRICCLACGQDGDRS